MTRTIIMAWLLFAAEAHAQGTIELEYPAEVFDYCVSVHEATSAEARQCLDAQNELKRDLQRQLVRIYGSRSDARTLYNRCLDYVPLDGVRPVAACALAYLEAMSKVRSSRVAWSMYRACLDRHGPSNTRSLDTCMRASTQRYLLRPH